MNQRVKPWGLLCISSSCTKLILVIFWYMWLWFRRTEAGRNSEEKSSVWARPRLKSRKPWSGGREENSFCTGEPGSRGASPLGDVQSLSSTAAAAEQFPLRRRGTSPPLPTAPVSLGDASGREHTVLAAVPTPIPTHPFSTWEAWRRPDKGNFQISSMLCEHHSYKQDKTRTQPLSPLINAAAEGLPVPAQSHTLYLCKQCPQLPTPPATSNAGFS